MTVFVPTIYCEKDRQYKTEREIMLEKQLDIASKALEKIGSNKFLDIFSNVATRGINSVNTAQEALAKIKELEK